VGYSTRARGGEEHAVLTFRWFLMWWIVSRSKWLPLSVMSFRTGCGVASVCVEWGGSRIRSPFNARGSRQHNGKAGVHPEQRRTSGVCGAASPPSMPTAFTAATKRVCRSSVHSRRSLPVMSVAWNDRSMPFRSMGLLKFTFSKRTWWWMRGVRVRVRVCCGEGSKSGGVLW